LLHHRHRDRIAAALGVLVDVERQRRAGSGRGGEVLQQLLGSEGEIGRRDDRHGIRADVRGVRRQDGRLSGGLGSAVDDQSQ
jgi:hypothetical protein